MVRLIYIALLLLLLSCRDDQIGPQSSTGDPVVPDSAAVLILNEGNFRWGNASLGRYLPDQELYEDGLFRRANAYPLGDVFQDLVLYKGVQSGNPQFEFRRYFAVLNGSNLIRVLGADWQQDFEFNGLGAPREIVVNDSLAWVSDLFSPRILVYNWRRQESLDTLQLATPALSLKWSDDTLQVLLHDAFLSFTLESSEPISAQALPFKPEAWHWREKDSWIYGEKQLAFYQDLLLRGSYSFNGRVEGLFSLPGEEGFYALIDSSLHYFPGPTAFDEGQVVLTLPPGDYYGMGLDASRAEFYFMESQSFTGPSLVYRYNKRGLLLDRFYGGRISNGLLD